MSIGRLPTWMEIRARPSLLAAVILGALFVLLVLGGAATYLLLSQKSVARVAWAPAPRVASAPTAAPNVAPPENAALAQGLQLQTLTPTEAQAFNAGIPISTLPNPAARPFILPATDPVTQARATDCLTAAIYYEAGGEPADGQRAVAQVVLNRVRHFAYPKSVCAVVFQESDRATGCQFTFACDGSLGRAPDQEGWKIARAIAAAALDGRVDKHVGLATHYHADTVAPYWQPYLIKVAVIGHHIFYRGAGAWSAPAAFAGRYAGSEDDQPLMTGLWSDAAMPEAAAAPDELVQTPTAPIVTPTLPAPPPPVVSLAPLAPVPAPPPPPQAMPANNPAQSSPVAPAPRPSKSDRRFLIPVVPHAARLPRG